MKTNTNRTVQYALRNTAKAICKETPAAKNHRTAHTHEDTLGSQTFQHYRRCSNFWTIMTRPELCVFTAVFNVNVLNILGYRGESVGHLYTEKFHISTIIYSILWFIPPKGRKERLRNIHKIQIKVQLY